MANKKASTAAKKAPAKKVKPQKPKNGQQYTQSELYECIQTVCGLESKKNAKEVYEGFAGMVQAALKKGYRVPLPGIGKIQVRNRKARMGRNPKTGEPLKIPAKKNVRLTISKALKEQVL